MIILIIISIIIQMFSCVKIFKTRVLHRILSFSIIFYLVLWITIPGVIAILINLEIIQHNKYNLSASSISENYIFLYTLESIVFLCVIFSAIAIEKNKISHSKTDKIPNELSKYAILFYLAFSFIQYFYFSENYLTVNDATLYGKNNITGIITICRSILMGIVSYIALTGKDKNLVTLSLSALILSTVGELLNGSRITFLTPVFIFLYRRYADIFYIKNKDMKSGMLILILAVVMLPVAKTIEVIRGSNDTSFTAIKNNFETKISFSDATIMIFTKFDSFSSGLRLIDGYGAGRAGLNPYIGSALVFLPRFVYPDRPVAGSMNDTIYGTPSRLVPQLYDEHSDSMNVGVSPVAISIWELGWFFGSIAAFIFGVGNFLILNFIFHTRSSLHKILAICIMGMPAFNGVFNSPDAILKNIVILFFIIALTNFLQWLLRYRDSIF